MAGSRCATQVPCPASNRFVDCATAPAAAPLADLIAPPYDVVDAAERGRLAERSPYNAIHVELPARRRGPWPRPLPGRRGVVRGVAGRGGARPRPVTLALRLQDELPRRRRSATFGTTGVIGALGLEPFGGAVVPHEQTMAAPGRDRLDLLRACRVNCSPIWGLSLAPALTAACTAAIERSGEHVGGRPTTRRRRTRCGASTTNRRSVRSPTLVAPAAGRHRRRPPPSRDGGSATAPSARHATTDTPDGCDSIMAFVAELAPAELALHAIHRLVSGLPDGFDLLGALARCFRLEPVTADLDALAARDGDARRTRRSCSPPGSGSFSRERPGGGGATTRFAAGSTRRSPRSRPTGPTTSTARVAVSTPCAAGRAQAAALVRPATVDQLAETVRAGGRMPPKSTYFHPKPRTGFVFRPLDR